MAMWSRPHSVPTQKTTVDIFCPERSSNLKITSYPFHVLVFNVVRRIQSKISYTFLFMIRFAFYETWVFGLKENLIISHMSYHFYSRFKRFLKSLTMKGWFLFCYITVRTNYTQYISSKDWIHGFATFTQYVLYQRSCLLPYQYYRRI
jgi:hypothetical protein